MAKHGSEPKTIVSKKINNNNTGHYTKIVSDGRIGYPFLHLQTDTREGKITTPSIT
jgi:hypothetical protein